MPDPVTPPVDPPAGDPPAAPPADPPKADPPASDDAKSVANLETTLKKVRDELKAANTKVKELEPKANAHDELTKAQQTELEQAQEQAREARDALNATTSKVRAANLKVALGDSKYGLASAKAAATLLQAEGIEFGDDDEPIDLDEAVEKLTEANPFLLGTAPKPKAPKTDGGSGGGGETAQVNLTTEELQAAKAFGMTPEEYTAYKSTTPVPPAT
jgi:hypothetical protein